MKYMAILLLFLCGCTVSITDIANDIPVYQRSNSNHHTVDKVLKYYFTDEAYKAVKDIPAVDGFTISGSYVPGVNVWASSLSIVTGSGWGRKVVFSKRGLENNGILTVLHEYFHHIDDMTRDGELDLISVDEFKMAWEKYKEEFQGSSAYITKFADRIITDLFGIGKWSEYMAYTLQQTIKYGGPKFMKDVYRKVIRRWPR